MKRLEQQLFIIAGANGTGKTALSGEFLKEYDGIEYLNADEIAEVIAVADSSDFSKVRIKAGKLFLTKMDNLIDMKKSFAIETTLSGKYLIHVLEKVRKQEYKISIIYLFVDNSKTAINRIEIRVRKGGHSVPGEDVIRRFHRSKENFWNTYKNFADKWTVFYNGDEKLFPVVSGEFGKYELINEELFDMFIKDVNDEKKSLQIFNNDK